MESVRKRGCKRTKCTMFITSAHDKQSILCQITSGKLDNAVQATNSTLLQPVYSQTIRNALKEAGLHSDTKKKVP